jgi:hypothetical protein
MARGSEIARVVVCVKPQSEGKDNSETAFCAERERLRNLFLAAVRELSELQSQQIEAVVQNDEDFLRFDDLLHMARLAREHAKYALTAHLTEHGCNNQPSITEEV